MAGISGGADSVALLEMLKLHGFRDVIVCHLDHGLRGRAAAADAKFVAKLAAAAGYQCESGKVDLGPRMESVSMETAAREARHRFFAACSRKHRCPRVLLAHHADDQAETLLWNLLRGSRGLAGMRASQTIGCDGRRIEFMRPLLSLRRQELRDWLAARKIAWREDASNALPVAVRNRLRNEALPLLAEIARRDVTESLLRAAEASADQRAIERWAVAQAGVRDPQGRLHVPKLRSLPPELQAACVHDYLMDAGVTGLSRDLIGRCTLLLADGSPPAVNLPGGKCLRRKAGRMFVVGA
nr:tRNA lysidine(34) synthetase TilS [Luteolibacter marinus]